MPDLRQPIRTRATSKSGLVVPWLLAVGAGVALGAWLQGHFGGNQPLAPAMPAGSPVESKAAIPVDPRMPMQLRVTRVITAGQATSSQAFISINGEPARPFAVGALVRDGLYVRSVAANRVRITNDDTTIVFDLAVEGADQGAPAEDPAALQIKRQMGAAPGS